MGNGGKSYVLQVIREPMPTGNNYFSATLVSKALADYARACQTSVYKVSTFCHYRPDFELEIVVSYLDKINGITNSYPNPNLYITRK